MNDFLQTRSYVWMCMLLCAGNATLAVAVTENTQEWRFRVYLDDSEIGYHNFTVAGSGGDLEIRTEADFNVRFLFFNAYKYRHRNTETWGGNCLKGIRSETNANGDRYSVAGSAREDNFLLSRKLDDEDDQSALPECVMTFAYWNPDFLQQSRLLNSQTGEYIDVETERVGDGLLSVRGNSVPSYRYRLTGEDLDIALWYSSDHEWLALESMTPGGRRIRYELI